MLKSNKFIRPKIMTFTAKCALLAMSALIVMSTCPTLDNGMNLSGKAAFAADHGSGGGGSSGSGGSHKGSGKGKGKGPNPDCPYKDGSGKGGYAGSGHGKGGHKGGHHDDGGDDGDGGHPAPDGIVVGNVGTDDAVSGGGGGGEAFVCDGPGSWDAPAKIYMNQ